MKSILERNLGFLGFPNYSVDTDGNVYSLKLGLQMKKIISHKGYECVKLCKDGNCKKFSVHRLVAIAFIPNPKPNEWTQVNHKNEIKSDNRVENLEWCDNSYNQSYGTLPLKKREKMLGEKNHFYGKTHNKKTKYKISISLTGKKQSNETIAKRVEKLKKPIIQYTKEGAFVMEWDSTINAAKKLNILSQSINRCLKGKRPTAGGFIWKYAEG